MATPRRDPHRRDPPMSDEEIFEMFGEQSDVLDFLGVPQRIPPPAPSPQASGPNTSRPAIAVRQPVGQTQSRAARGPMTLSDQTRMEGALRNQTPLTPLTPTKDEIIATQTRALANHARENAELKRQIADQVRQIADQARKIADQAQQITGMNLFISSATFESATVVTRAVPSTEPSPRSLLTVVSTEPSPRGSFFARVTQVFRGNSGNAVSVLETPRTVLETPRTVPETPRTTPRPTPRATRTTRTTPRTTEPPENAYAAWEEISPVQAVAPARPPPPAIRQRAGTVASTEQPVYAVARRGLPPRPSELSPRPRVRFQTPGDDDEHDVEGTIA